MRLRTVRLVSFTHRHLAAIEYELTAEDADTEIVISSELVHRQPFAVDSRDPRLAEGFARRVLHPTGSLSEGLRGILSYRTQSSGLTLGCGMDHVLSAESDLTADAKCNDDFAAVVFKGVAKRGKSSASTNFSATIIPTMRRRTKSRLKRAGDWIARSSRASIVSSLSKSDVSAFWNRADVQIEGGTSRTQQVIRWNLFQLLQASKRSEGHGIADRGLTGRTYEGHYFWDTEIYVLPFLVYTRPQVARSLLKFRYDMLDEARARAKELGQRGATFPWRTINGKEASAYYAAGTAQHHINADIAYALRKYVGVSGDDQFLRRYGAEILIETARFWYDLGFFSARKEGRFCINGVTGPDEYSALVNNNYFTVFWEVLARAGARKSHG